jgi:putative heme iron utilization protein
LSERIEGLRALLAGERSGVLATLSVRRAGWPFTSIAPYALTTSGEPILLLSDLAEHTHNVRADSRASLFVQDSASREEPQAGARLTLLGQIELLRDDETDGARARYLQRQPSASALMEMQDFRLYVLHITEARFICGFGDMGWIGGAALLGAE